MEEERATTATTHFPTATSLNGHITILEVVTQCQKAYPDLVFIKREGKDGVIYKIP